MAAPRRKRGGHQGLTIFVVSDATGVTGERMVRSALVQFGDAPVDIVTRVQVRTAEKVSAVVREAARCGALVMHTLVSSDLRRLMLEEARSHDLDAMDLLGPVLDRLATRLSISPREEPGLFKQLRDARTRQIEAVEFAFRHDDGQHTEELELAEIVVVGVSRTMKTPTMLYLAYHGWFAANVPIVAELELPDELLSFPIERVFCLDISEDRLLELRRARAETSKIPLSPYASLADISRELRYARRLCEERGWRKVDVTGKSVEEVAREILTLRSAGA